MRRLFFPFVLGVACYLQATGCSTSDDADRSADGGDEAAADVHADSPADAPDDTRADAPTDSGLDGKTDSQPDDSGEGGCPSGEVVYYEAPGCEASAVGTCSPRDLDACGLITYCDCNGMTFQTSCSPATRPYVHSGPCHSTDAGDGGGMDSQVDAPVAD